MKQGFTIVWLGWEQDLPASPDLLHLAGPVVDGVRGLVYGDFAVPTRVTDVSLGDRGAIPYAVADLHATENTLTVRLVARRGAASGSKGAVESCDAGWQTD